MPPAQWLRGALVHWPAMSDDAAPAFVTDMPQYWFVQQPQGEDNEYDNDVTAYGRR